MTAEYPSLKAFYDDQPERRLSGEADYGVCWREGNRHFPVWRVSYVQATGEVIAVCQPVPGQVKMLGVVPPDPHGCYYATLDRILDGWEKPEVSNRRLSWVKARLNDNTEAREAVDG